VAVGELGICENAILYKKAKTVFSGEDAPTIANTETLLCGLSCLDVLAAL
jgi:hypothetical protein